MSNGSSPTTPPELYRLRLYTSVFLGVSCFASLLTILYLHFTTHLILDYLYCSGILLAGSLLASPRLLPRLIKKPHFPTQPEVILLMALCAMPAAYGTYYELYSAHGEGTPFTFISEQSRKESKPIPNQEEYIAQINRFIEIDIPDVAFDMAYRYVDRGNHEIDAIITQLDEQRLTRERDEELRYQERILEDTESYEIGKLYILYPKLYRLDLENDYYRKMANAYHRQMAKHPDHTYLAKYAEVIGPLPDLGKDGYYDAIIPYVQSQYPDSKIVMNECNNPSPRDEGWFTTCSIDRYHENHLYRADTVFFIFDQGELNLDMTHLIFEKIR